MTNYGAICTLQLERPPSSLHYYTEKQLFIKDSCGFLFVFVFTFPLRPLPPS